MTRRLGWWVPVMLGTMIAVFALLMFLRHVLPGAFPRIQGPRIPTELLLGAVYIGAIVLLSKAFQPAIRRNPLIGDIINGAGAGAFVFALGLVS